MIDDNEFPLRAVCVCGLNLYRDSRIDAWEHVGQVTRTGTYLT
jgi:hypothetical protein